MTVVSYRNHTVAWALYEVLCPWPQDLIKCGLAKGTVVTVGFFSSMPLVD